MFHELKLIEKYFKNIIANLLLSAVIMFGFFVKARVLTAEVLSTNKLALLLFCEFVMVLVLAVFIAYTMRTLPQRRIKLFCLVLMWSLVLFAETCFTQKLHLLNCISNRVFIAIYVIVRCIICGIMILSVCNCLKCRSTIPGLISIRNLHTLLKSVFLNLAVLLGTSLFAFIFVNPGKRTKIAPPQQTILARERILFLIILFFFIPFYVLTFILLYEDMTKDD